MIQKYQYEIIDLDLTIARHDVPFFVGLKNSLTVHRIDDVNSNITIKFDKKMSQGIPINIGQIFNFKDENNKPIFYERIYISNDAVGAGHAIFGVGKNIELQMLLRITADVIQNAVLQQVITIGNTATEIPLVALNERINLLIYNPVGGAAVYIGSSTVTVAGVTQGMPILPGGSLPISITQGVTLYGITATSQDVNILEGS